MTPPVALRGVTYAYESGDLARPVLRDVDLSVAPGEVVLLTGPSGSGKTTLLTLIGALRALQSGSATVLGQQLAGASERQRTALRSSPAASIDATSRSASVPVAAPAGSRAAAS